MSAQATSAKEDPVRRVFTLELAAAAGDEGTAVELLARRSGLAKARVKDAMQKGAVWLARGGRKAARLRRVTTPLLAGDRISLYYDSGVLDLVPPTAKLVLDNKRYSIWRKPAGLLVEGSRFGDHATLARQVAMHFVEGREVYLVHRLDLEASGLVLVAHSRQATARLSELFRERTVDKRYRVEVLGDLRPKGPRGRIELALDGKTASTEFTVDDYRPADNVSVVSVRMLSGRYHQIRRHFDAIGHPVMGDPKYGRGNKNQDGMRLDACGIAFTDPWTGRAMSIGDVVE